MRRRHLPVLLAAAAGVAAEPGDTEVETGVEVFTTDDLSIESPWLRARATVGGGVAAQAEYRVDVVTAASVDVVSQATASYSEERHQVSGGLDWEEQGDRVQLLYFYGTEPDYRSHALWLRAGTEVVERTWRLDAHTAVRFDELGRVGDAPASFEPLRVHEAGVSVSHALTPLTEVSLVADGSWATGALQSPYRLVPLLPEGAQDRAGVTGWVAESHPDVWLRGALAAQVRHALTPEVFATLAYRHYADDWAIRSSTVTAGLNLPLPWGAWTDLSARLHRQDAAGFYRSRYGEPLEHMTRDRRLGGLWTGRAGLALRHAVRDLGPLARLRTSVFADGYVVRYDEFNAFDRTGALGPFEGSFDLSVGLSLRGTVQ